MEIVVWWIKATKYELVLHKNVTQLNGCICQKHNLKWINANYHETQPKLKVYVKVYN